MTEIIFQVTIHADSSKTKPGSRRYIHAKDVADGLLFILSLSSDYKHEGDFGGAKCPKFNLVGEQELNNLELAQMIAVTHKEYDRYNSGNPYAAAKVLIQQKRKLLK